MPSCYYPDDISGRDVCYMEGCRGRGPCPDCGETNYHLMGYYGALARWSRAWGVTEDEAEERITAHQEAAYRRRAGRLAQRLGTNRDWFEDFLQVLATWTWPPETRHTFGV